MVEEKQCLIIDKFGLKVIIIKEYGMSDRDALMYARIAITEEQ